MSKFPPSYVAEVQDPDGQYLQCIYYLVKAEAKFQVLLLMEK